METLNFYTRVPKKHFDLRIHYGGEGDFVATFGINNISINRSFCSIIVLGESLDTGTCLSEVDD